MNTKAIKRLEKIALPRYAKLLDAKGFKAAIEIAKTTKGEFLEKIKGSIPLANAEKIYLKAVDIEQRVQFFLANIKDTAGSRHYTEARFSDVHEDLLEFHQKIHSYQDIFGQTVDTDGEAFTSIYSPAAYFLDLLWLIDNYIATPNQPERQLKTRRPDLWKLSLDVEHTTKEVPYLQIANQVMLDSLKEKLNGEDATKVIATSSYPFEAPYNLPLEKIRTYLSHFKLNLGDIYAALGSDKDAIAREKLGLSQEAADMLTQPALTAEEVVEAYGVRRLVPTFNGKNTCIDIPYFKADFTEGFTLEVWVKPHGFRKQTRILDFGGIRLANQEGQNSYYFAVENNSEFKKIKLPKNLENNQWTHIALTLNKGQGEIQWYLNGKELGDPIYDFPSLFMPSGKYSGFIGKSTTPNNALHYEGQITELRIWNKVQTPSVIQNNLNRSLSGGEDGLVGYWPMNTKTSKDKNIVAHNLAAPLFTSTWRGILPLFEEDVDFPMFGNKKVLTFEGDTNTNENFIDVPSFKSQFSEKGMTIETWVKFDSFESWSRIIDFKSNSHNILLANKLSSKRLCFRNIKDGVHHETELTQELEVNKWTHIALTINTSGVVQWYVNGLHIPTKTQPNINLLSSDIECNLCYIGKSNYSTDGLFKGNIADLRIWNIVRTPKEVQENMFHRLTGNEEGLNSYWRLDSSLGKSIRDWCQTGNGTYKGAVDFKWTTKIPALLELSKTTSFLKQISLSQLKFQELCFQPPTSRLGNFAPVFNNEKSRIQLPPFNYESATKDFTVEALICLDSTVLPVLNSMNDIVVFGEKEGNRFHLRLNSSSWNNLQVNFGRAYGPHQVYSTSKNQFKKNEWIHIAVATSGDGDVRIYINGVYSTTKGQGGTNKIPQEGLREKNYIGGSFKGQISEVRIWSTKRSEADIRKNMFRRMKGNEPHLIGYWPLNGKAWNTTLIGDVDFKKVAVFDTNSVSDMYVNQRLNRPRIATKSLNLKNGYQEPKEFLNHGDIEVFDRRNVLFG